MEDARVEVVVKKRNVVASAEVKRLAELYIKAFVADARLREERGQAARLAADKKQ
ncbi:MAG TPA: hypothetical protein VEI26_03925 [Terriglobales bacterium]|nr:hypothetical protein [Terriglobales bacterium]